MPTHATMAAFFSHALTRGLVDPLQITKWVDAVIMDSPKAEEWMLDLSTEDDPKQMLHHLYQVSGQIEESALARLIFDALKNRFEKGGDTQQSVRDVFELADYRGLPEHKTREAYQIDREADLCLGQAELHEMLHAFFASYEETL